MIINRKSFSKFCLRFRGKKTPVAAKDTTEGSSNTVGQLESSSSMVFSGRGPSAVNRHYQSKSNKIVAKMDTVEEHPDSNNVNIATERLREWEDLREQKPGPSSRSLRVLVRKTGPSSRSLQKDLGKIQDNNVGNGSLRSGKQKLWRKRSKRGTTFRRLSVDHEESIVMFTQSASDRPWEAKLTPGVYQLSSLIDFPDMGIPTPRHAAIPVKRSDWHKANGTTSSGTLALSPEVIRDTVVPVEFASNLLLEFYGATLIDSRNTQEITLRDEHVIQDFTYAKDYFHRYARHRGGLEVHDFAHLDCPMDGLESSGLFVLGKWNDTGDALFVTAFRVPQWHALFIPGGVIHTNDYLCGTWRTMLSWTSADPIDHVHLVEASSGNLDHNTPLHIEPCDCGPDLWQK